MVKSLFVYLVFLVTAIAALTGQDQSSARKDGQVVLKYLGTAGWEITDGTTVILIDPYLSRINGPAPQEEEPATPSTAIPVESMDGMISPRQTSKPLIRIFNEPISSLLLIRTMTTSWMFPTSLSRPERRWLAPRAPKM